MNATLKTLADYRKELHISKSQVKIFLMCPQKYFYQYVVAQKWERKPSALILGSAVHEAVAEFYRSIMTENTPLSLEQMSEIFTSAWSIESNKEIPIQFNGNDEKATIEMGINLLKVFMGAVKPRKIFGVELPFSVPIPNSSVRLVGAFDLIEEDEDGNRIITELKTSAKKWSDGQVETEMDSATYSYAFKQMGYTTNGNGTLIKFDVLIKTKKPSLETYYVNKGEKDHKKMLSLVNKILHAIETEAFYPIHGWQCGSCPFMKYCSEDI